MFDTGSELGPDRVAREPWFGIEHRPPREGTLDKLWAAAQSIPIAQMSDLRGWTCRRVVGRVEREERSLGTLDDAELIKAARRAGQGAIGRDPGDLSVAAPLFAAVREAADRALGLRHYPVQLMGGLAMMRGYLAEMQTGEGKTLTATLAASAMALAGRPVHVVTVNDYLAERDAEEMTPVYNQLGLSVGLVVQGMEPSARREAYAKDVTYCSNKELAFDYLKDRLDPTAGAGRLSRRTKLIHGSGAKSQGGLQRGLAFALIDEADSVLIDEARTPLILSGEGPALFDPEMLSAAVDAARDLEPRDYTIDTSERRVELRPSGIDYLDQAHADGHLANRSIREELVTKALTAWHLFHRDEHYLVREGKVEIVDEYTGRVMPDRFWTDGLHQMIELKEEVELSRGRITLGRTTYQRFFRRYDRIAGMSGTAREIAGELWRTYRLKVARIPTHRPSQRKVRQPRIYRSATSKWAAIATQTAKLNQREVPVLIGTRSVAASEVASNALNAKGVLHVVLSAAQDVEEAQIIGQAGQLGRVTVATNMAGRGADIKLSDEARARGGLHVIMSESHDSRRIDRQLQGRAGRQGDPGWYRAFLSLDDPIISEGPGRLYRWIGLLSLLAGSRWRRYAMRRAQAQSEALHARMRRDLLKQDEVLNDAMAFAGEAD